MDVPQPLVAALVRAQHVVALTGAGVSAESGVPTFREAQTGLWSRFRAEDLATPEAFDRDPALVWRWYQWRRGLVAKAAPNAGHLALVELASLVPRLSLITQNVDGLHQRAGSREVVEFHGNLFANRCRRRAHVVDVAADDPREPPTCPTCGSPVRPGVVWFGEAIPQVALDAAMAAAQACEVFLSIGTSAQVYPAAGLAAVARRAGATVVEINPDATPLTTSVDHVLQGASGIVLPQLVAALRVARAP